MTNSRCSSLKKDSDKCKIHTKTMVRGLNTMSNAKLFSKQGFCCSSEEKVGEERMQKCLIGDFKSLEK